MSTLTPFISDAIAGLFVFTRFPQPGHTKTRLIPAVGAVGAANLQRQMTEHLLNRFQNFCWQTSFQAEPADQSPALALQVHFTGGTTAQMLSWLGNQQTSELAYSLVPQCSGDLGERLSFALDRGFAKGLTPIVVVGSDCPSVDSAKITQALALLGSHDVVIGPATDGGYYLIGLNRPCPFLFEAIPWSTEQVLETTRAIAGHHNLSIALLSPLSDIDSPEDLPLWYSLKNQHP
ncbi:MAG: TIGR04282 family arsenosugar biosynthesis glycosyltransferase [Phormidesmis sp.]